MRNLSPSRQEPAVCGVEEGAESRSEHGKQPRGESDETVQIRSQAPDE